MSNQRFHIFDKILYFLKIRQDLLYCSIKGIIIITRLPKLIKTREQLSISSIQQTCCNKFLSN